MSRGASNSVERGESYCSCGRCIHCRSEEGGRWSAHGREGRHGIGDDFVVIRQGVRGESNFFAFGQRFDLVIVVRDPFAVCSVVSGALRQEHWKWDRSQKGSTDA